MRKPKYFLKPGYRSREQPEYFIDEDLNAVWQPDVYPEAAGLARRLGARKLVDVGCGTAAKLVALHPEFEIVGIDFGSNIEACRGRYDVGKWIEADFDRDNSLGYDDVTGAVLVCADVIEHLIHPERLLRLLRRALDSGASALVLSTPERELYNEPGHLGPPPNTAHVREWALTELEQFLASEGLTGHFGLTRSNDVMPYMQTILAVVPGESETHRNTVAAWWDERAKWEHLAVEHDRTIAEVRSWAQELRAAQEWAEHQRKLWQQTAEEAQARLATLGATGVTQTASDEPGETAVIEDRVLVTVVTEAEPNVDLTSIGEALERQTYDDWEWVIATTGDCIRHPTANERVRVVSAPTRARRLRSAIEQAADTSSCSTLTSTRIPPRLRSGSGSSRRIQSAPPCTVISTEEPRMLRRAEIDRCGGIDAALGEDLPWGFVPNPDTPMLLPGLRSPDSRQSPNAWLPDELPFHNRRVSTGRRLLLIVPWMTVGGADKFNLDFLDEISRFGWQVTVATTLDGSHEWYPHYQERTTDLLPLAHFLKLVDYPRFLRYLIESRQPDVVLLSNSELGYKLLPFLRTTSPDVSLVDLCHSEAEHWNSGGYPRFSVERCELLDLTITVSEHLKHWMVSRGGRSDRIEVNRCNVDADAWRPLPHARVAVRRELGLEEDEPIVLFAGRVSEDKQPQVLGKTIARLASDGVRFAAIIAGDGPDRPHSKGSSNARSSETAFAFSAPSTACASLS